MEVFILPAVSTLISLIWSCLWLVGAVYIFSVGEPEPREGFPFITEVQWSWKTKGVFYYHCFGLLWLNAFIIGSVQFMIGGATCIWYFECQTDTKGRRTLKRSSWWLARYHWASIAFGALVIALCQAVRAAFEYYRRKTKTLDQTLKWVKVLLCATSYILYLMERCVKYMTKNAYIQIALTNQGFCASAWCAFTLMIKNVHRFGMMRSIGSVFSLFGGIVIAVSTGTFSYLILTSAPSLAELTSPVPPTIVTVVIGVLIAY